jgi:hypothetical protein
VLLDLDAQSSVGVGRGGAGDAAVDAGDECAPAVALDDAGDGADGRVLALVLGTSRTSSSSPTSAARWIVMSGKTTASSRGTSSRVLTGSDQLLFSNYEDCS